MSYNFLLILILASCNDNLGLAGSEKSYLHISHTRTNSNASIDSITERINFGKYDMLLLGGDLMLDTSQEIKTMEYVDSIFNVGNVNTLWSIGNHDYSDLASIEAYTNRLPYYAFHKNGITFIVLDTQDSLSNIVGSQKIFFDNVADTIQESSHLVILHHKLIWMDDHSDLELQVSLTSNGRYGDCFYCINPNNFYKDVYPKLLGIKKRGIEVICVAGDIGFKAKEFEFITSDSIVYLASGISSGDLDNKALVFSHNIAKRELIWKFILISEL